MVDLVKRLKSLKPNLVFNFSNLMKKIKTKFKVRLLAIRLISQD